MHLIALRDVNPLIRCRHLSFNKLCEIEKDAIDDTCRVVAALLVYCNVYLTIRSAFITRLLMRSLHIISDEDVKRRI